MTAASPGPARDRIRGSAGGRARAAVVAAMVAMLAAGCADTAPTAIAPPPPPPDVAVDLAAASFTIAPFEGMPGNAADDLTQRIARVAAREGMTVVRGFRARAAYRLRGYLTAIGNSSSTTVAYTFEIEDAAGQPLHRFSGQEPSGGTNADPWTSVDSVTLDVVAERVVASVKAWFTRER